MIQADSDLMDEDAEDGNAKKGAKKKLRFYCLCFKRKAELMEWFKINARNAVGLEVELKQ